jgi:predicted PurR-regulated permease PerM
MISFFKNNYNLRKSLYTLAIVIIAILFYRYTENMQVNNIIPIVLNVLSPFIIGAICAYLVNCIMSSIEKLLVKIKFFKTHRSKCRILSLTITFVALFGLIAGIISYIIPEIIMNVQNVINFLVRFEPSTLHEYVDTFLTKHNIDINVSTYRALLKALDNFFNSVTDVLKYLPDMLLSVLTHIISFASSALDIIIGLMIMVYILIDKEKIIALGKRVLYLWFSDTQVKNIVDTVKNTNNVFNSFFIGKTVDSIIIGILFFIGALILDLPYSMLFALIIGLTNMIPYFGPFIGAIPVTALTMLDSPIKGVWVLIFIIILQQFDGIILGPKILGSSTGLKPIGVIFAIIVGGAIAGPLGMFFGVPIFSVALTALMNFIDKNYNEKTAHLSPIVETEAENENTKASE